MKSRIVIAIAAIAFASTAAYAAEKCCCDKDKMAGMEKMAPATAPAPTPAPAPAPQK